MQWSRRRFLEGLAASLVSPAGRLAADAVTQAASWRGRAPGEARTIGGMPFCWCPGGRFVMGSPTTERGRRPDEAQVEVVLTRGFWTATHEVTQDDWRRVSGVFPGRPPTAEFGEGDDYPVYWVSFEDAERYCIELTRRLRRSGDLPPGWAISLPTEAQWEYACRAGTRTATAFGETLAAGEANFGGAPARPPAPRRGRATRVRSYPANAWGLHDMHGNVWEWCRDFYHARLPGGTDPDLYALKGEANRDGTYSRVRRGGAWIEPEWACRSACRLRYEPHRSSDHIGFRVVAAEV
jgi:formylglycine-generating enzyme required for sulfatase activity